VDDLTWPLGATPASGLSALPPEEDPRPFLRLFDTCSAAAGALRSRHATLNRPEPADPIATTLTTVRAA